MTIDADVPTLRKRAGSRMPTTQSTLVRTAGQRDSPPEAQAALRELCALYLQPVHEFIRCWLARHPGRIRHCDARDLTQAFMADLLARGVSSFRFEYDGRSARFRTWLLGAVQNFLSKSAAKDSKVPQSVDAMPPARRAALEPRVPMTPERMFTIAFASCLGSQAWYATRAWYAERGQQRRFDVLERFIPGDEFADLDYAAAAAELQVSYAAARKALERLRLQYQMQLWRQIRRVVPRESEVDDEFAVLFGRRPTAGGEGDGL